MIKQTAMEDTCMQMVLLIMANGKTISNTVKAQKLGQMDKNTRVTTMKVKNKEKGRLLGQMAVSIRVLS